jgi:hypothetical protein
MRQMAFDHISIPAMSAETERVFSDTKLFISGLRSRNSLKRWSVYANGYQQGKSGRHISQSIQFIDQKNIVDSILSSKTDSIDYSKPFTTPFSITSDFIPHPHSLAALLPFQGTPGHPCIPFSNSLPLCPSRNPSSPPSSYS